MRWLAGCLIAFGFVGMAAGFPADEGAVSADLAHARHELITSTREYRASLERLLAIQETAATRAEQAAANLRRLHEQGIVSRRELEEGERAESSTRAHVNETGRRLAEADSVLGETLAAIELARVAAAGTRMMTTPTAIGSLGEADITSAVIRDLDRFFASRFARALPVSALGQTPVHDRLGLDHRHALDVAVHPDSEEGRILIEYLQRRHIPFLAFRGVVPGASTAAHVHIGRVSARVVPVRAVPR
jgi:hypothetical protein